MFFLQSFSTEVVYDKWYQSYSPWPLTSVPRLVLIQSTLWLGSWWMARKKGDSRAGRCSVVSIYWMFPCVLVIRGWATVVKCFRLPWTSVCSLCVSQDTDAQPAVSGCAELGVSHHYAPAAGRMPGHRRRLEHPACYLWGQICGLPCDRFVVSFLERLENKAYRWVPGRGPFRSQQQ